MIFETKWSLIDKLGDNWCKIFQSSLKLGPNQPMFVRGNYFQPRSRSVHWLIVRYLKVGM